MKDIRLIHLEEMEPMAFGVKEMVGTLVAGGILFMIGMYAYVKVGATIDQSNFTAAENATFANIKTNITAGFDLGSVIFIVIAAGTIIGVIWMAFR